MLRRHVVAKRRRKDGLVRFARNVTSQSGEDGILAAIFDCLDGPAVRRDRWLVDVGAWDGVHWSNSHALLVAPSSADGTMKASASSSEATTTTTTTTAMTTTTTAPRGRSPPGEAPEPEATTTTTSTTTTTQEQRPSPTPTISSSTPTPAGEEGQSPPPTPQGGAAAPSPVPRWRGVLIEADPKRFAALRALHEPLGNVAVRATVSCAAKSPRSLVALVSKATSKPGVATLGDAANLSALDLLTIDIDGPDYWVWKSALEAGWRARVVVIEFNPTIPHDVVFVQDRDDRVRQGASLAALVELARDHGYRLAETTTYNAVFVLAPLHRVLVDRGLCFDADAAHELDALHDLTMGTALYQLYDGTLKLAGCKKLLWHRRPLDEAKIQHLAEKDRVYPLAPADDTDDVAAAATTTTFAVAGGDAAAAAAARGDDDRGTPSPKHDDNGREEHGDDAAVVREMAPLAVVASPNAAAAAEVLPNGTSDGPAGPEAGGGSPTHKKTSKQRARSRRKHKAAAQQPHHRKLPLKGSDPHATHKGRRRGEAALDALSLYVAPALGCAALVAVATLALRRGRGLA